MAMMLRRLAIRSSTITSLSSYSLEKSFLLDPMLYVPSRSFLDLYKIGSKEAIEKEKARLSDELSRGYFADISEIRKTGGKVALANKTIIPSVVAVKFPDLDANFPDNRRLKLPVTSTENVTDASEVPTPCASLLCLSFRASSQRMAESWSLPFLDSFSADRKVQIYEVSFIDSWLLSLGPVRHIFLKMMNKSSNPQRHIVYAFGDHYDFRKKLHILNLLTGYIFLLDRLGRIRWQGFGYATQEELSALLSCTALLLDEK
ncbi:mitochondrial ATPase complex subunit ATP10-like isoform X1 [Typha latifolia]|uniref:mitochondrial ATPase complex subunit ATP10-like isoform X1 n=2 Tax=Typha latifolia TaxID=4733 RepID=UPI003C2BBFF6